MLHCMPKLLLYSFESVTEWTVSNIMQEGSAKGSSRSFPLEVVASNILPDLLKELSGVMKYADRMCQPRMCRARVDKIREA